MKTLAKLEKSRPFWAILLISTVFFLLRLPSLIEPYWYGDEGIYQVIGQALNQGRLLYVDIWDNKPPFLYIIYAIFNGNQESVRLVSLLVGLVTTIFFFALSQKLFKKLSSSIIATSFFAILFATPFLEGNIANAENFMLLPIILSGLLIFEMGSRKWEAGKRGGNAEISRPTSKSSLSHLTSHLKFTFFLAGLLLGIAFMFKIVAIFDLAAFLLFIVLTVIPSVAEESHTTRLTKRHSGMRSLHSLQSVGMTIGVLLLGFLFPLILATLFFLSQGAIIEFFQATFSGNVSYVGLENTFLNIPQGLLILKVLLLIIGVTLIFLKKSVFSKPTLFILLWLTFSLFNSFFSQRPYTHYLLVLLPSVCLFIGLLLDIRSKKLKFLILASLLGIVFLVMENFWISLEKTPLYYQNMALFITGKKDVKSYRSFFDHRTPRDYELAAMIAKHTTESDDVFIWGDSAQIYALSHKLPIDAYTVAYHIQQNNAMKDTQRVLTLKKPKYIITLSETQPLPFSVPFYSVRYVLTGATVYERNF